MAEMSKAKYDHIVCAIRGRPANRNTVERAIELALEHHARLGFHLVIPEDFLEAAAPLMSPARTVFERLREMGEYILAVLCDEAHRRGVRHVDVHVHIGDVREELLEIARQSGAQVLVLGEPDPAHPRSIFTPESFREFVRELEQAGHLTVIAVPPESWIALE